MPLYAILAVPELNYRHPCHSLLANFAASLYIQFSQATQTEISIGGVPTVQASSSAQFRLDAGVGILTQGIVLGTGITPVDIEDIDLAALIPHGNGAGQLAYGSQFHSPPTRTDNAVQISTSRQVVNNSGNSIIVQEVGTRFLYAGVAFQHFREIIDPIPIAPGQARTFSIIFIIQA